MRHQPSKTGDLLKIDALGIDRAEGGIGHHRFISETKVTWELMLLHDLGTMHLAEVDLYLERMRTEDIATVAAEADEVVKEP